MVWVPVPDAVNALQWVVIGPSKRRLNPVLMGFGTVRHVCAHARSTRKVSPCWRCFADLLQTLYSRVLTVPLALETFYFIG